MIFTPQYPPLPPQDMATVCGCKCPLAGACCAVTGGLTIGMQYCNIMCRLSQYLNICSFTSCGHLYFQFDHERRKGRFSNHAHLLTRTHNQTFYFVRCVQKLKFKRVNCFHRKSRKGLCILVSNPLTIIRFGSGFLVLKVENTDVFQYILNIFNSEIDSDKYLVIQ